jgi:hypothetical protein
MHSRAWNEYVNSFILRHHTHNEESLNSNGVGVEQNWVNSAHRPPIGLPRVISWMEKFVE